MKARISIAVDRLDGEPPHLAAIEAACESARALAASLKDVEVQVMDGAKRVLAVAPADDAVLATFLSSRGLNKLSEHVVCYGGSELRQFQLTCTTMALQAAKIQALFVTKFDGQKPADVLRMFAKTPTSSSPLSHGFKAFLLALANLADE